jgi:hypothetical protein
MERRVVLATVVSALSFLYCPEMALADTGKLCVYVTENGQSVSDAEVTATCIDAGCDSIYTLVHMGEGLYCHSALRTPHSYEILAEKGSKSATTTLYVQPGMNPDVHLSLTEAPQEPWEASTAEASSRYGSATAEKSSPVNHMIFLLIPGAAILVLRIRRRAQ